jgi:hypothetical protein
MGAFFTNLHVRGASTQTVCGALPKFTPSRGYVSPSTNGWVTVYTEATEDQDQAKLCALAAGLSKWLAADVLAFLVHDSSVALYWLYHGGELADQFNSRPDYFGETVDAETRERVRGRTDVLLPLCVSGTTPNELDEVLHPPGGPPTFAEEIVYDLARLLGIDDARASLGFEYFTCEGEQLLPDAGAFEPVGKGAERLKSQEPEPEDLAEVLGENLIPLPADAAKAPEADEPFAPPPPVPDMYPVAISMLTQLWGRKHEEAVDVYCQMSGLDREAVSKKMVQGSDLAVRELLKKSTVPDLPGIEELIAARNKGPEPLAELIAKKTPGQLVDIGVVAAGHGLAEFVAALLKLGLDPNAPNAEGFTTLNAAEQHGPGSAICRVVKAATDKQGHA